MAKATCVGFLLLVLAGCQEMSTSDAMPPNQPIAGNKFAEIRSGMTYAEFERTFGQGWTSPSMGTDARYWFFDDGRTLVVSADVWKSPDVPLKYHLIGARVEARMGDMPILQGPTDINLALPH